MGDVVSADEFDHGIKNRAHLYAILRSSADAITTITVEGIVESWSRGAEALFGFSAAEVVGKPISSLILTDDQAKAFQPFDRARHGDDPRQYKTVRKHRDGGLIDVAMTVCPIIDDAGALAALSVIYRDISAEKLSQSSVDYAHSMFKHLVETSPFGVYVVDSNFRMAMVGIGARKAFEGIEPLIGRDFAEIMRILWPEPFASETIAHFRHVLDHGESYSSQSTIEQRANIDEVEAYDWKIERILLPDGRYGVVCHFYDLSERQRYEAALTEGEIRLGVAIDGAELGTWGPDPATGKIVWNKHALRILGYEGTSANVFEQTWAKRVHPEDADRVSALYKKCQDEGVAYHAQHRIITPDGTLKWVEVHGRQIGDTDDDHFAGVFADITERKRAEEQIKLLMGEVNHRSKNLLAVVQAVAQQTSRSPEEKAYVARLATRIIGLSASQDLMLTGQSDGIDIAALVRAQLAAFSDLFDDRITMAGSQLWLTPSAAQSIGMALHELGTNAAKYGALSVACGQLAIKWSLEPDIGGSVDIRWEESGGPPVAPPTHSGFGQIVMVQMLKSSLRANIELDYAESGLVWKFTAPAARLLDARKR